MNKKEYRNSEGQLHRVDGPAIEWADGTTEWWLNDSRHRENGPAVESADGTKEWWLNGKLHREDGPAIEYTDGVKEWFLNGEELTEEEFNARMPQSQPETEVAVKDIIDSNLSDKHKLEIISKLF